MVHRRGRALRRSAAHAAGFGKSVGGIQKSGQRERCGARFQRAANAFSRIPDQARRRESVAEKRHRFMKVTLFIPCFVDMFYPNVGISVVQILERLGHTIDFPEELSCCGQPAFNSGYWDEARAVAMKVLERLKNTEA